MRGKKIIMRSTPAWLVQVCGGNNTHTHRNTGRERQQHERQQHPPQKNACMFVSLSSYPLGWGGMQVEYVYISCFLFFTLGGRRRALWWAARRLPELLAPGTPLQQRVVSPDGTAQADPSARLRKLGSTLTPPRSLLPRVVDTC